MCRTAQDASHEPILTLLPGLHGTAQLYEKLDTHLQLKGHHTELIVLPQAGDQDYQTLQSDLEERYDWSLPRILIAESFSGPLAIYLAARHPDSVKALVLVATFCASPVNRAFALLPLSPIFMLPPIKLALRYFLTGEGADYSDIQHLADITKTLPAKTINQRLSTVLCLREEDCPTLPHVPILILQAQFDHLIPWAAQNALEQHFPHAEVHWLASPHLIIQQAPQLCYPLIDSFIAQLKSQPTHVV